MNIAMAFACYDWHFKCVEMSGAVTNAHHRFVYNDYLCIQRLDALSNNLIELSFAWDPTEPVATRPLVMQRNGGWNFFYTHDGNKNVSDVVSFQQARGVPAHYEYAPFGEVTVSATNTAFTAFNVAATNPFRFSTEYTDDTLGLVYYNYRHYNFYDAKWLCRDIIDESHFANKYSFVHNRIDIIDVLGLAYGNPVSGPNGPVGSGWGSYYPKPWEHLDLPPWYEKLPDCPCSIPLDETEMPLPSNDGWSNPSKTGHKGGTWEIRSKPSGLFGSGQQCVYDSAGKLINEGSGAGTPDMFSPEGSLGYALHIAFDVGPYYLNKWLSGPAEAERLDHDPHPPNKGKDRFGIPCPSNDGSDSPPSERECRCLR